ncbi:MAG: DsbA family oxidoreductase [Gemmatimonadota bacterium]
MSESEPIEVEIWSDVVCPWCYIGKRRFEGAVEQVGAPVRVTWRSFELDPSAPREPDPDLAGALARKYGMGPDEARGMLDQMTRVAADEGLDFDFANAKGGNTLDAHRLIHFARGAGGNEAASAMKERLLRAYFLEGRPIADRTTLAELASELGHDREDVQHLLESEELVQEVRSDEQRARELGIRGVPFFVLDGKLGISGAQPVSVMVEGLRRARLNIRPPSGQR